MLSPFSFGVSSGVQLLTPSPSFPLSPIIRPLLSLLLSLSQTPLICWCPRMHYYCTEYMMLYFVYFQMLVSYIIIYVVLRSGFRPKTTCLQTNTNGQLWKETKLTDRRTDYGALTLQYTCGCSSPWTPCAPWRGALELLPGSIQDSACKAPDYTPQRPYSSPGHEDGRSLSFWDRRAIDSEGAIQSCR